MFFISLKDICAVNIALVKRESHHSTMPCELNTAYNINSSSPGQKGRNFAADIFKCIFVNEDA